MADNNNYYQAVRGFMGLFGPTNKARKPEDEGDAPQNLIPEFESSMTDENIITLTKQWVSEDETYGKDIKQQQKDNVNYWIGKQLNDMETAGTKKPLVDNLIFEAVETFLPIATRGNPQAIVTANGTPEGDKLANTVQNALEDQAKTQHLRMKLKGITRDWALYLVGCGKVVWDSKKGDIDTVKVLPSRIIFDPHATIDVGGIYRGDYLGERKKASASKLLKMFPSKATAINTASQSQKGTKLNYIEWWTHTDVFYTLGENLVLGKYKNPHWNYTGTVNVTDVVTGAVTPEEIVGVNHFKSPEIPYLFLTVFNLNKRPHDETSLISQNIPLQDLINKRYQQIDKNVDSQNNGIVLSGDHFTKEQAAEAATQLSKGNPLWVPEGDINSSYKRDQAPQLAADVFNQLQDARSELRNIFGTSGSSAQSLNEQDTVRGKIMVNQMDSSRIGGGVTEYIEQLSESFYNWYVQMIYVYYTDEHSFSVVGAKATELMKLKNTDIHTPLKITVKDGSLIPKDPLTKRNEAMDLWSAGAIDPISLYTALDVPNPYESAKELLQWQLIQKGALPPQVMFPDLESPQVPLGTDPTNAVNPQEAQAEINPTQPDTVGQDSKELLASVPLQ